jgi:16S rRNA (uracil1498-N3)-methyltransferase
MSEPRFYDPALDADASELCLEGDEGHHLTRVLRLPPGARLRVFDGRGTEVRAEVASIGKRGAVLRLLERVTPVGEPSMPLTLGQALLKSDKMDAVVRDATMMGVRAILPVLAERTVVPARAAAGSLPARWHRIAVASAKQCGRAIVPDILEPRSLADVVVAAPGDAWKALLVEPSALDGRQGEAPPSSAPPAAMILVGPEGGWSAGEVERALSSGWRPWSLGDVTLRAETAPLAALAILRWVWRVDSGA